MKKNNNNLDNSKSLNYLFSEVQELLFQINGSSDKSLQEVRSKITDSVIRPLQKLLDSNEQNFIAPGMEVNPTNNSNPITLLDDTLATKVCQLALNGTSLSVLQPDSSEILEATSALQDLSLILVNEKDRAEHLANLFALQAILPTKIQVADNGPYLVTNLRKLEDWLGQVMQTRPHMALCRCGASTTKPFCDGSHAFNGFTDTKDPNRVPDKQDAYLGQQVTILDNRGTCQHSGFCTDRLASVFHLREEPFITPSGGRMDEIMRAVRDCPSGALSFAIDGVEARAQVDFHKSRESKIEVSKDGPYRISGAIDLVDANNVIVERNEGASYEHYALCRCGKSQNKPFCSGMHWYVDFHDPVENLEKEPTIFEWAGGYPAMLRMTQLFYGKFVPQDPLLSPLFASMSPDHAERVARWLSEVFCGPPDYSKEYGGYNRMIAHHLTKRLNDEQRSRWVMLLLEAAKEAGLPNDAEFRSALGSYLEWGSRLAVENSQIGAKPPENMPMPKWDWNTAAGPPSSRVSALAKPVEEKEQEVIIPSADEDVSFNNHIKALFRKKDRQSMTFIFDLWLYEDVRKYAGEILRRVENGTMPCDSKWPGDKVELFRRWYQSGMAQ